MKQSNKKTKSIKKRKERVLEFKKTKQELEKHFTVIEQRPKDQIRDSDGVKPIFTVNKKIKLCFKEKIQNKLESGRFRWINEKLYTSTSSSSCAMFQCEPELFTIYHQGFLSQVNKWPINPVDVIIKWILKK